MHAFGIVIVFFLCLLFLSIIVFSVFFLIYQYLLKKEFKLKNEFNEISIGLITFNFSKMELISQNNLVLQDKLRILKNNYQQLRSNVLILKESIIDYSFQNKRMNVRGCWNNVDKLLKDLEILENQYKKFQSEITDFCRYSETITSVFNAYREIYLAINNFYEQKIQPTTNFKNINDIVASIRKKMQKLEYLSFSYDFENTVATIGQLQTELTTFYSYCQQICVLKKVRNFVNVNIQNINQIIQSNYDKITNSDFENITKLITIINSLQKTFIDYFNKFELKESYFYCLDLIKNIEQLNNFIFINLKSVNLIDESNKIIENEIHDIISNSDHLKDNLKSLSNYFDHDQELFDQVKAIIFGFNTILNLYSNVSQINSKSYVEKKEHLQKIDDVTKKVIKIKDSIIENINAINQKFNLVLTIIKNVNDLIMTMNQVKMYIEVYNLSSEFDSTVLADTQLINMLLINLKNILIEINSNSELDLNLVQDKIYEINNQFTSIAQKVNNNYIAHNYASKLIIYANRYITDDQSKKTMEKIDLLFNNKQYYKAVDLLIEFIKKVK